MQWLITGSTDGEINKLTKLDSCGIIIIGDSYFCVDGSEKLLKSLEDDNNYYYCIRGAVDWDPKNKLNIISFYDNMVNGVVYLNPNYPNVRFLENGNIYNIKNKKVLVIGGGKYLNEDGEILKGKTFYPNNILSENEINRINEIVKDKNIDIVLSYTAPLSWEKPAPEDISIMEKWLDDLKNTFHWKTWVFSKYRIDADFSDNIKAIHKDVMFLEDL